MTGQLNSARYSDNASSKDNSARRSRNPNSVANIPKYQMSKQLSDSMSSVI